MVNGMTDLQSVIVDADFLPPAPLKAYVKKGLTYIMCGGKTLKVLVLHQSKGRRSRTPAEKSEWDYRRESFSRLQREEGRIEWNSSLVSDEIRAEMETEVQGMFMHPAPLECKLYILEQFHKRGSDVTSETMEALEIGTACLFPISSAPGPCVVVDEDLEIQGPGYGLVSNGGRRLTVIVGGTTLPRVVTGADEGTYVKRRTNDHIFCHDFRAEAFR